ncbi:hypothetical protein GQ55_2G251500 [Panicum hallii var. hallii]|uniref:Uncharacterized protein n=2 Tax=Panicum hallii TaxID=206008 RepID=A0A2T7ES51_9POAL|nr:hypothetical protein GQ55_2G251500 [Panicum hallii var. hallii]PVH64400.1 hypothetical protein PAHAL_2G260200 [Panicum hallii]
MASSASLRTATIFMLAVLFAGQLLMAAPAAADGSSTQGLGNRKLLQATVVPIPVCAPFESNCANCYQFCVGKCNTRSGACFGPCFTNCKNGRP